MHCTDYDKHSVLRGLGHVLLEDVTDELLQNDHMLREFKCVRDGGITPAIHAGVAHLIVDTYTKNHSYRIDVRTVCPWYGGPPETPNTAYCTIARIESGIAQTLYGRDSRIMVVPYSYLVDIESVYAARRLAYIMHIDYEARGWRH